MITEKELNDYKYLRSRIEDELDRVLEVLKHWYGWSSYFIGDDMVTYFYEASGGNYDDSFPTKYLTMSDKEIMQCVQFEKLAVIEAAKIEKEKQAKLQRERELRELDRLQKKYKNEQQ